MSVLYKKYKFLIKIHICIISCPCFLNRCNGMNPFSNTSMLSHAKAILYSRSMNPFSIYKSTPQICTTKPIFLRLPKIHHYQSPLWNPYQMALCPVYCMHPSLQMHHPVFFQLSQKIGRASCR